MKSLPIFVVILVIVAAAAFFAGTKYQASQGRQFVFNGAGGNGQARRFGNGANGIAERGQIVSVSDSTLTIKLSDGSSKIILLPDSATVNQTVAGSKTDLKQGETVAVFGTSNSDGSVTAVNIQINPEQRGGQPSPKPSSQP